VPPQDRPPANTMLHWAFDTMVGICTMLIALGLWLGIAWWRKRDIPQTKWFLRAVAVSGVASVVALECGWIVTEVGRQPWIIYNVMRTSEAVTPVPGQFVALGGFTFVYVILAVTAAALLIRLGRQPLPELAPEPGPPLSNPREGNPGERHAVA
jgi:cytochrome d ubiquinol oxidase subunit I